MSFRKPRPWSAQESEASAAEPPYGHPGLRVPRGEYPGSVDVAIIGGGIVGSASAWYLAKRGARVVLIEKDHVASDQSGRNWGFVRMQGRDPAELPLAIMANRIWSGLGDELGTDIGWTQGGNLALTDSPNKLHAYEEWARMADGLGLGTRVVEMNEIRELLPGVQGSWLGGIYTSADGHANPAAATVALAQAAQDGGATVLSGCTVDAITLNGCRVSGVHTSCGPIQATTVVLAAGIGSARLAAGVGVRIPLGIATNSVLGTEPLPAIGRTGVWSQELAFRQMPDGRVVLSAERATEIDLMLNAAVVDLLPNPVRPAIEYLPTWLTSRDSLTLQVHRVRSLALHGAMQRYRLPHPRPNMRQLRSAHAEFVRRFPRLGPVKIEYAWAGHIDGTPDRLPIIDRLVRPAGLVLATGFSGHGFCLGPAAGAIVASIVAGDGPEIDLKPMRFARFAEGSYGKPKGIL